MSENLPNGRHCDDQHNTGKKQQWSKEIQLGCLVEREVGRASWTLWIGLRHKGEEKGAVLITSSQPSTREPGVLTWGRDFPSLAWGKQEHFHHSQSAWQRHHCGLPGFSLARVELKLTQAELFICPCLSVLLSVFCYRVCSIKIDICTKGIWVLTKPQREITHWKPKHRGSLMFWGQTAAGWWMRHSILLWLLLLNIFQAIVKVTLSRNTPVTSANKITPFINGWIVLTFFLTLFYPQLLSLRTKKICSYLDPFELIRFISSL